MELRQLEYFVTVAEQASFTKAAAILHVAQPGISAQIRRLERDLGQALLDRSGRTVRLTDAGAAALPHARAALATVADVRSAVDELSGLLSGHVAVGTVTSHNVDIPALLAAFHDEHPGVEITLTEANSDRLIRDLHDGNLDLALIALPAKPPPGLHTHIVVREAISAAVSRDHALAKRSTIPLAELGDYPLICLPPGSGIRSRFDEACGTAGVSTHIAFEAGAPPMLATLAAHGLGVAILPASVACARAELHSLPIVRPALRGGLAFAWRAAGAISPAAKELISRIPRTFAG